MILIMNPFERIQLHNEDFTKIEQDIRDHILNEPEIIVFYPLIEAADRMKVSKSALLRFCQKCGYEGFSEFKYEVSRLYHSGKLLANNIDSSSSQMIEAYIDSMKEIGKSNIDDILNFVSESIISARKIRIFGLHETGLAAQHLQFRLSTLGIDSDYVEPTLAVEKANFSDPDDLFIYFSLSAKTSDMMESLSNAIERKCRTVLITQNDRTKFINLVNYCILVPTFNIFDNQIFRDAQLLNFLLVELIILNLSKHL